MIRRQSEAIWSGMRIRKNRRMLVTDETNNIYLLNTPLSPPVKLIEKIVPYSVKVRPDGESFAYTSRPRRWRQLPALPLRFQGKNVQRNLIDTDRQGWIDRFIHLEQNRRFSVLHESGLWRENQQIMPVWFSGGKMLSNRYWKEFGT